MGEIGGFAHSRDAEEDSEDKPGQDYPWANGAEAVEGEDKAHTEQAHNCAACPYCGSAVIEHVGYGGGKAEEYERGDEGGVADFEADLPAEDPEDEEIEEDVERADVQPHITEEGGKSPLAENEGAEVSLLAVAGELDGECYRHQGHYEKVAPGQLIFTSFNRPPVHTNPHLSEESLFHYHYISLSIGSPAKKMFSVQFKDFTRTYGFSSFGVRF